MTSKTLTALLDVPIGPRPLVELIEEAMQAIDGSHSPLVFACANPHSLVAAQTDSVFNQALLSADQVVADGVGTVVMGRFLGANIGPRITGSDYFFALMRALEQRGGGRVFFFGSSEQVLGLITHRMSIDFSGLTLCGCISPPFGSWNEQDNERMLSQINEAKPDILWVGMTAPKQEKWVFENRQFLDVPVIGSIGAVFDFFAGTKPRAPDWMCKLGLEWLYRLLSEPRRMWRRNLLSTPIFIFQVLYRHVFGFLA